jgi:omega-6 fatty acid desaturase (delta-12 desaturase)
MQMAASSPATPHSEPRRGDRGTSVGSHSETLRTGRDLLRATERYAFDSRSRSWLHLVTTVSLLVGALVVAGAAPWWPVQLAGSILATLIFVRAFILFHDFMHGAILKGSKVAEGIFFVLGMILMTPPNAWRYGHNYHHKHVGKRSEASTGSFPLLTTSMWRQSSKGDRLFYRIARHPLTIVFAILTVFAYSICFTNFRRDPRKYWDSAAALLCHLIGVPLLAIYGGFEPLLFLYLIPVVSAGALGAYLFYSQHNFVGMQVPDEDEWDYHSASVATSSYLETGALMRFFTGNIGFHHVHHLNAQIPFYRLPQVMAEMPELQNPIRTTLRPRDVIGNLRLKLWDESRREMVTFRDVATRDAS